MMLHEASRLLYPLGRCFVSEQKSTTLHLWKVVKNFITKIVVLRRWGVKCSFEATTPCSLVTPCKANKVTADIPRSRFGISLLFPAIKMIGEYFDDEVDADDDGMWPSWAFTDFRPECIGRMARIVEVSGPTQVNLDIPSPKLSPSEISHSSASEMGRSGSHKLMMSGESPYSAENIEERGTQSEDEECSGDSIERTDSQSEVTSHGRHVSRTTQPRYEANYGSASKKRSPATVMKGNLLSMIGPYLYEQIEVAIETRLSDLRRKGEEDQRYQDKLLAMEVQKLGLKRRKLLFTQRVLANAKKYRLSRPQLSVPS